MAAARGTAGRGGGEGLGEGGGGEGAGPGGRGRRYAYDDVAVTAPVMAQHREVRAGRTAVARAAARGASEGCGDGDAANGLHDEGPAARRGARARDAAPEQLAHARRAALVDRHEGTARPVAVTARRWRRRRGGRPELLVDFHRRAGRVERDALVTRRARGAARMAARRRSSASRRRRAALVTARGRLGKQAGLGSMSMLFRILAATPARSAWRGRPRRRSRGKRASNARVALVRPGLRVMPGPYSRQRRRARVLYLPPLDGNSMAPFASGPGSPTAASTCARSASTSRRRRSAAATTPGSRRAMSDEAAGGRGAASKAARAARRVDGRRDRPGGRARARRARRGARARGRRDGQPGTEGARDHPHGRAPHERGRRRFPRRLGWSPAPWVIDGGQARRDRRTIFVDNPLNVAAALPAGG